jgi:prepilin-type N-terminal cleavage/methylation domain-containing protein
MLTRARNRLALASPQGGFTLPELLVSMIAGLVVMGALFTILDVTLHQTSRTYTELDVTQHARPTIEAMENELHSACIGGNTAPIQVGSDANNLIFVTQYGTAASLVPQWHQITYNAAAKTLTESVYAVTGSAPNWTRAAQVGTTRTLLTNVQQRLAGSPATAQPVFQYFSYEPAYTDSSGNTDMIVLDGLNTVPGPTTFPNPDPLATPLSAVDAPNTVEVLINMVVGASGAPGQNASLSGVNDTVTDAVLLRLTPPENQVAAGADFGPCQ